MINIPGLWLCECGSGNSPNRATCGRCLMPKPALGIKTAIKESLIPCKKKGVMTETERRFNQEFLGGEGQFEAITFNLRNSHKYTPDFVCFDDIGLMSVYEVKGAYKLHSYQRAKLAFDQARVEFPAVKFVWAELKEGKWVAR